MNKKTALVIIIVAIIIGLGIGSYFIFFQKKTNNTNSIATVNSNATNNSFVPDNYNPAIANMAPEQKVQAESRDSKRLSDIRSLQTALDAYNKKNDGYPEKLTDLLSGYINAIPGNPNPGGIIYTYTPIGTSPYAFYDLGYVLEVGAEGLEQGFHTASPNGLAVP